MRVLLTGASGFVGGALLPRLERAGHEVRAFTREPSRVSADVPVLVGDAVSGAGLAAALDGVELAYYLIHSLEPVAAGVVDDGPDGFAARDALAARNFAEAASAAGVGRVVYLGGLVPATGRPSPHLASRLEVERTLLERAPGAVALRASIVIGARSRSFRFLVRLIERVRVLPLPPWRHFRTQPIDGRDVLDMLLAAGAGGGELSGRSLDIAGPEVLTYGELLTRIRDHLLVGRPALGVGVSATGLAGRVAAAIAGERHELVGPLMAGLVADLLPRDMSAPGLLGVRLHSFDAAVERALRDWEAAESLRAR